MLPSQLTSAVARFAKEVIEPKVREMDENEKMDPTIIKGLYGMLRNMLAMIHLLIEK